jgi:Flp pilus assembly protein TadD
MQHGGQTVSLPRYLLAAFLLCFAFSTPLAQTPNVQPDTEQVARVLADLKAKRLDAQAGRALGFQLISLGRYDEAWLVFDTVLSNSQQDQQAAYGGALALFNLKRFSAAKELAMTAVSLAGSEASRESDALVILGVILAVEGDNQAALRAVNRAAELSPNSFDAQFSLGRALYGSRDLARAVECFRKSVTLRPTDGRARFFLATTLEELGDYVAAKQAYGELIELQPNSAEGHLGLGVLLTKLDANNYSEAISELRKAVSLDSNLYEARIALGKSLIKAGRAAEAVEHLRHATLLAPNNPEPHYQLAIAYRRLGDVAGAARASAKVNEINSSRRAGIKSSPAVQKPEN